MDYLELGLEVIKNITRFSGKWEKCCWDSVDTRAKEWEVQTIVSWGIFGTKLTLIYLQMKYISCYQVCTSSDFL